MSDDRRRELRFLIEVPVTLAAAGVVQQTVTRDVSHSGLFALTESPPPISQLTRVQIELPDSGQLFETHAMSVFVLEPDNPHRRPPGCGLKFYAMSEPNRQIWRQFVDSVRRPTAQTPPRRRRVTFRTRVEIAPKTTAELESRCREALSTGVIAATTTRAIEVGRPLRLDIVHPETGAVIRLHGVAAGGDRREVAIRLDPLDDQRRAALAAFCA